MFFNNQTKKYSLNIGKLYFRPKIIQNMFWILKMFLHLFTKEFSPISLQPKTPGKKDIGIRQFEFVTKAQFLSHKFLVWNIKCLQKIQSLCRKLSMFNIQSFCIQSFCRIQSCCIQRCSIQRFFFSTRQSFCIVRSVVYRVCVGYSVCEITMFV